MPKLTLHAIWHPYVFGPHFSKLLTANETGVKSKMKRIERERFMAMLLF